MKLEEYQLDDKCNLPIRKLIDLADRKIVLLDDTHIRGSKEGCKNLLAVDQSNNIVWIADLPTSKMLGAYWTINYNDNELTALYSSFRCIIDIETGKVLSERFERF